ncbi:MAG: FAD-binding protein, partial [Bacteroidales bacterium]|nr:FAD-binding protein [Bacteroidales bacterium]
MIQIHQNRSLKKNTTFRLDIVSPLFTEPKNISELQFALAYAGDRSLDRLVIGEGSNLLFAGPFDGLIIHPVMQGIELVDESATEVLVKAGAGVNWDSLVAYCVQQKWYGTENLSLIPGSVGAAPVQNIGAYGVEAKDIVEYVEVFNTIEMKPEVLSNAACEFGYRDSVFKHGGHDRYIVTGVVFRLAKKGELVLDYGNVREALMKRQEQDLQALRATIIAIRQSKLP